LPNISTAAQLSIELSAFYRTGSCITVLKKLNTRGTSVFFSSKPLDLDKIRSFKTKDQVLSICTDWLIFTATILKEVTEVPLAT
jgi:hypothetical protein